MDKITKKIVQIKPVNKIQNGIRCKCYTNFRQSDNKPLKLMLDSKNRLLYCDHCGNIIDPILAIEMLCKKWDTLVDDRNAIVRRIRRAWEIGRNYRPWKRAIKDLEKQIGRRGENLPCCPHCDKAFKIEDITTFKCAADGHRCTGYKLGDFNNIERL